MGRVHVAWLLCLALAVLGTYWATRIVVSPPQVESEARKSVSTVTVVEGTVEESQVAAGTAIYQTIGRGLAGRSGILTSTNLPEDGIVRAGDVVATIDMEPVLVLGGRVPMFRDLAVGVSGPDVAQLRSWLGLDESQTFDEQTQAAVLKWQREAGLAQTGQVLLGQVVFVPTLPAPALVAPDLQVGDPIDPGQVLIDVFAPHPDVYLSAQSGGKALAPGLPARLSGDAVGVLVQAPPDEQGPRLAVVDDQGAPLCTDSCAAHVPPPGPSSVEVTVEVISPVRGPMLPRAAILFAPDGNAQVLRDSGELVPITIMQEAQGQVVVEGVEAGDVVRLFPEDT